MENKDSRMAAFHAELIRRFGPEAFVLEDSEGLGSNHVVYRSRLYKGCEISLVAGGDGQSEDRFSMQVELNIESPDFDVPLVADNLALEAALEVFSKYHRK